MIDKIQCEFAGYLYIPILLISISSLFLLSLPLRRSFLDIMHNFFFINYKVISQTINECIYIMLIFKSMNRIA